MPPSKSLIPVERIEKLIYLIRGHKVMIDSDLAELYGVTTGALNQALKRNIDRVSTRLCVPTFLQRIYSFDITNCDIKHRARWPPETALGFHRTRSGHAFQCA